MEQTDIQFKDDLCKEQIMLERFKELAEADKKDELLRELERELKRISASLHD